MVTFGGSKPPPYRERYSIIMLSHREGGGGEMTLLHGEVAGVEMSPTSRMMGQGDLVPLQGFGGSAPEKGVGPEQGPTKDDDIVRLDGKWHKKNACRNDRRLFDAV